MRFRGMGRMGRGTGVDRRTAMSAMAGAAALGVVDCALAAETGVTDTRIKVGQSAVFTGPAKDFGVDYKAGIALAFDKVNKTGGMNGRTLELVSHDDAYEPKKTAENTAKLIDEDKVFALIGYVATGNLIAAMPIAEKAGVPMFAPLVGTTSVRTTHNRYLFHVRASYETELRKIVGHLATLGINNIAVIYQNSAFGKSNLDTCLQIAQGLKVKVVDSVPMEIAATDAKPQVAQLTKAQPGAVVMIIGLNLAPVTVKGVMGNSFNMWMSLVTVLCMGSIAVFTKGLMQRLLLLRLLLCPHCRRVLLLQRKRLLLPLHRLRLQRQQRRACYGPCAQRPPQRGQGICAARGHSRPRWLHWPEQPLQALGHLPQGQHP